MSRTTWLVLFFFMVVRGFLSAQSVAPHSATVTAEEIGQALRKPSATGIKDVKMQLISAGNEYNVGVFAVRRTLVDGKLAVDAYQHHDITEIYQIVKGSGTLVTGGTLEQPREFRADDPSVLRQIGPTLQGVAIKGGASQTVGPGDIVVIPANTPHGFADLAPEGIEYVIVRIDPHKVLAAK